VPLNFIKFNLFENAGSLYGTHPWYWYFMIGIPTMLFTMLPLFIIGIAVARFQFFTGIILWNLLIYSCLPHKEIRFLLQIMPLACYYCAISTQQRNYGKKYYSLIVIITTSIILFLAVGVVHQRGPIATMYHLRSCNNATSVHFLMPCHSTPFYSYLHRNISMKILDCSPNIVNGKIIPHETEDQVFFKDPLKYLEDIKRLDALPSHIVIFENLADEIGSFLKNNSYIRLKKIFHTYYPIEKRQSKFIHIYAKQNRTTI